MRLTRTLVVASLLVLAACGGDDAERAVDETAPTASSGDTTAAPAEPGTTAVATTAPTTPTSAVAPTTASAAAGGAAAFCDVIVGTGDIDLGALSRAGADPTQLRDAFTRIGEALPKLQAVAPAEISADLETFTEGFVAIDELYRKYDYDPAALAAAASQNPADIEAFARIAQGEWPAAGERLGAFVEQECGVTG